MLSRVWKNQVSDALREWCASLRVRVPREATDNEILPLLMAGLRKRTLEEKPKKRRRGKRQGNQPRTRRTKGAQAQPEPKDTEELKAARTIQRFWRHQYGTAVMFSKRFANADDLELESLANRQKSALFYHVQGPELVFRFVPEQLFQVFQSTGTFVNPYSRVPFLVPELARLTRLLQIVFAQKGVPFAFLLNRIQDRETLTRVARQRSELAATVDLTVAEATRHFEDLQANFQSNQDIMNEMLIRVCLERDSNSLHCIFLFLFRLEKWDPSAANALWTTLGNRLLEMHHARLCYGSRLYWMHLNLLFMGMKKRIKNCPDLTEAALLRIHWSYVVSHQQLVLYESNVPYPVSDLNHLSDPESDDSDQESLVDMDLEQVLAESVHET